MELKHLLHKVEIQTTYGHSHERGSVHGIVDDAGYFSVAVGEIMERLVPLGQFFHGHVESHRHTPNGIVSQGRLLETSANKKSING